MKVAMISLAVVILALVAGGAWWLVTNNNTNNQQPATDQSNSEQSEDTDSSTEVDTNTEVTVTITYTDEGFQTSSTTVPAGSTIVVVNESSGTLQFASNPHPQHTDNSELNLPTLAPGERESMVVEQTGTWGFHNHLNDSHTGSLTVTD